MESASSQYLLKPVQRHPKTDKSLQASLTPQRFCRLFLGRSLLRGTGYRTCAVTGILGFASVFATSDSSNARGRPMWSATVHKVQPEPYNALKHATSFGLERSCAGAANLCMALHVGAEACGQLFQLDGALVPALGQRLAANTL